MDRGGLGPACMLLGASLFGGSGLGCAMRFEYLATDGSVLLQDEPNAGALASVAKASGVHDLGCPPEGVSVHEVRRDGVSIGGDAHVLEADGCGQRAVYAIVCTGRRCPASLVSRLPVEPAPRAARGSTEKWRPALEGYAPVVRIENVTAIGAAATPFARYLVAVHNRIHPIFADGFLEHLSHPPAGPAVDDPTVFTTLEIVLDKDTGRIVRMGVVRPSGHLAFDVAALETVERAAPFGKAPDVIASPDGNVYLHWEFHRNPYDACTTRNARPYLLKAAPTQPVRGTPPPPEVPPAGP